jgi:hypothetical protein
MKRIRIAVGELTLHGELNDSETARLVAEALPIRADARRWGEEVYFSIPVEAEPADDARAEVAVGEIAFWPAGSAFCIFFGPTPASTGETPVAASPVNVIGRVLDDVAVLSGVRSGAAVSIEDEPAVT